MYSVQDRKILVPVWSFLLDSSIPRNITFLGKKKETVVVHSLRTGLLRCYDSETGTQTVKPQQLRGAVGFVAFSPDEQLKAVHDLNTDCYVLYNSARPTTPVASLAPAGSTRKIKGASFAEGGGVLVCGGDNGFLYIYNVDQREEVQRLEHPDDSTVCALATYSTQDCHFIASGEGETPAQILIWAKPTANKELEEKRIEAEEQQYQAQTAHETQAQARAAQEAATHRAEVAARAAKMDSVVALVKVFVGLMLLAMVLLFIGFVFCGSYLRDKKKKKSKSASRANT
ncbi:hypothetical protein B0H19DRAFT_1084411 [Mycena capillaripes]|nr:hypothetical protein B0H19DRAFT_1084411 [Mycena capillaripes]